MHGPAPSSPPLSWGSRPCLLSPHVSRCAALSLHDAPYPLGRGRGAQPCTLLLTPVLGVTAPPPPPHPCSVLPHLSRSAAPNLHNPPDPLGGLHGPAPSSPPPSPRPVPFCAASRGLWLGFADTEGRAAPRRMGPACPSTAQERPRPGLCPSPPCTRGWRSDGVCMLQPEAFSLAEVTPGGGGRAAPLPLLSSSGSTWKAARPLEPAAESGDGERRQPGCQPAEDLPGPRGGRRPAPLLVSMEGPGAHLRGL